MMWENNEKILTIEKGQELNISVSDDIRSTASFMHPAYRQAVCAVASIVHQSLSFHQIWRDANRRGHSRDLYSDLFQYGGNVIAFAGPRGSGKTSTMLSFAKLMGEDLLSRDIYLNQKIGAFLPRDKLDLLKQSRFIPLPPIAPSILGEKQSILTIVLSRLYSFAANRLDTDFHYKISDQLRNNISKSFRECLDGLRGVQQNHTQDDFAMLQDVVDGMSLRVSFYRLIQYILEASPTENQENTYLVLQLDDADSQLKVGYDVLEDIRKYLMIPNLIILTSADFDMLRKVVLQRYAYDFSHLTNLNQYGLWEELSKAASKYIDKLIPPTNLIYLPNIEAILRRWGTQMKLRYGSQDDLKNIQSPPSLQTELLSSIYRKTGVILWTSANRPHDMIPTTVRGINHLLYLLDGMKDLPSFVPSESAVSRSLSPKEFLESMALYVRTEYLPIAEDNLQRFTDYFVQDWINARILTPADRDFLNRLERSTTAKIQLAEEYLDRKYPAKDNSARNNSRKSKGSPAPENDDVSALYKRMEALEKSFREKEDLSLFFAVKMLITLDNHMCIFQQKRISINEFYTRDMKYAFQPRYFEEDMCLPHTYHTQWKVGGFAVAFQADALLLKKISGSLSDVSKERYDLLSKCLIWKKNFCLHNIITYFLLLPELKSFSSVVKKNLENILKIYQAQETALRIAANWDVWDVFGKNEVQIKLGTEYEQNGEEVVNKILGVIDNYLIKILDNTVFSKNSGILASWNEIRKVLGLETSIDSVLWTFIKKKGKEPGELWISDVKEEPLKASPAEVDTVQNRLLDHIQQDD